MKRLLIGLTLFLSACQPTTRNVEFLRQGMTYEEVKEIFGTKETAKRIFSDGRIVRSWVNASALGAASVSVQFDSQDTVVAWSRGTSGLYK